ncbi:hypothetical protein PAXINDRAFT_14638 [Paxillus involutus ATCC 200175]|uniref:Cytochrome P450 n=1 Tax=Paxillus involutus ATCC 200175 TaxID=664439 RepID=A0A0C9TPW0_PAXIN|nr:hypothetical protein PAXINDRAFT_14638 [Paxillus involutus ATCC 200175]
MPYSMPSASGLVLLVPVSIVALDILRRLVRSRRERKGLPLPPGPTPLPLLGNIHSGGVEEPWSTYTEWQAKYGDMVYARLLGQEYVILNSQSDATELLEKRSQIYSDRPFVASIAPYGMGCNFAFEPYGDHWRLCRRIFHQTFRADSAATFRPLELRTARQIIVNMIDDPDQYASHYLTFSAALTLSAVYDYEISPRNDPMMHIVNGFLKASMPAATAERMVLLGIFPFLLHIPNWLPGSWIRREARASYEWAVKMIETPYQYAQKQMESSQDPTFSMVSDHITRMKKYDEPHRSKYGAALKHASATAFLASAETTSSSLANFTLAMVENPHVWKRAQAEIDSVIGMDRLPEFDDRPSLPYVEAILRETMRWQPVVPLTLQASRMLQRVVMFIRVFTYLKACLSLAPRSTRHARYITGAIVFTNIWAMSRDEARYPNAAKFVPERFLTAEGELNEDDPSGFVFGFGRRRCPGRYAADASLWIAIATMLATLDFNLAKDAGGKDITFEAKYIGGATRHPATFPCRISPRSHIKKECVLAG